MPFKTQEKVSVLFSGDLVEGTVIAIAKDDTGNYAYQVEVPNDSPGSPSKWVKACDIFVVEPSAEGQKEREMKRAEICARSFSD